MLILPFHPETASATIVIDGVTYRVPIVDSDGHLQVDVLSNPLPTDAATATNQATMITALQLIDDLRNALDAVQSDRLNVNVYRDGASEVKSLTYITVSDSSIRATMLTPTSGKKVRIINTLIESASSTLASFQLYFGTGANLDSDASKVIAHGRMDQDYFPTTPNVWPDGGGPVGAVDDVVSVRVAPNITNKGRVTIHYREE